MANKLPNLAANPLKARGLPYKKKSQKLSARQMQHQRKIQRIQEAVNHRLAGYQYTEIGKIMGIDSSTAYRYVQEGLSATATALEKDSVALRTMELERLEAMWRSLWPKAIQGDVDAIDRCMRISMQRTKLQGLDIDHVELTFDEQAMSILAEIITRRVDERTAALIQSDFASFALLHGQSDLAALPDPNTIEGDYKEVE